MFEFIRTHQRLMQFMLLLVIFPSFAFFGLEGYTRMTTGDNAVAKVAGVSITQQQWDAAKQQQLNRYREMTGGKIDVATFDTPEVRQQALDTLISQRALIAEARRKYMRGASESEIQAMVLSSFPELGNPALPKEVRIRMYNEMANEQGLSVAELEEKFSQNILIQNVAGAVELTSFTPKTVAARLSDLSEQEREVQELIFKPSDFTAQVKVTDAMLKDYYDKKGQAFEIPEQVKAEYVVLSPEVIASQITISDADAKTYYDQNVARYSTPEQRRASHILITVKKDAPAAEKAAAKDKAEKLLAQLRKNPADFARLAKENSQDPASAERGGDLDFFIPGKGMLAAKEIEDAAVKLKQGEIGDVAASDFGYHIVQVTGIKPGSVKPFEQVKADLIAEIKKQQVTKKFSELAPVFVDLAFNQADSLKPVADKLNLKIETVGNLGREPNPAVAPTVPYNNAKFLKALFSDETIKNKHNTEAVEVAPGTLIAGRVVEHKPASKKPFEEVKASLQQGAVQQAAMELARKAGEARLAELTAKPDAAAAGFGPAKMVSRGKTQEVPAMAFPEVMKADVSKLPAYVGADIGQQGYGIFRINKVAKPAVSDAARRQGEQQQLARMQAQNESAAYLDVLKKRAKVKILKPAIKEEPAQQPEPK